LGLGYRLEFAVIHATAASRDHRTATTSTPKRRKCGDSVADVDPARIAKIPLFAELDEGQRRHVAEIAGELDVDAGTTIAHERDFGYAMFAIEAGTADVRQDGRVIRRLAPGDVFGEIAVLASGRRTADVVATADMQLITVFNRDLWRLEADVPELVSALRTMIAARLELSAGTQAP
jgi:CRP-like cAMP-binding protein